MEKAIFRNDAEVLGNLLPTAQNVDITQGWLLAAWYGHKDCLQTLAHTFTRLVDPQCEEVSITAPDFERLIQIDELIARQYYIADATALHLATGQSHLDCVEFLLDADSRPKQWESVNNSPPMVAARFGHVDILKMLLDKMDEHYRPLHIDSFLMVACQSGKPACVKVLCEAGSQVKGGSCGPMMLGRKPPMYIAAHNGHTDAMEVLLQCGAPIDGDGKYIPLSGAAIKGSLQCVQFLLNHGASLDNVNNIGNVLSDAAYGKNVDIVKLFLEKGCHVNHRDASGNTALHMAALRGNPGIVQILIEAGANPNIRNTTNSLPIYRAIPTLRHGLRNRYLETLKELIRSGSDLNGYYGKPNDVKTYNSPLFKAIRTGQPSVIDVLLIASGQGVIKETLDVAIKRGISEVHLQKLVDALHKILSLKELCRHAIRQVFTTRPATNIPTLPLPLPLLQFLQYPEFDDINADLEESLSVSDA